MLDGQGEYNTTNQAMLTTALLSFLSGIGVTLVAALLANFLQRQNEKKKRVDAASFDIYMKLMELHGYYFWVLSAEIRGEAVRDDIKYNIQNLSWKIADILRYADEIKHLSQILDVLFSDRYNSTRDRYKAIGVLIDSISKIVNPCYSKVIKQISESSFKRRMDDPGFRSNAPGHLQ